MQATDVKVFVPAKNFRLSLDYYLALGWKENWNHNNEIAELELADNRIYLQDFYVKAWAQNFMMYIEVDSAQNWYVHINNTISNDSRYKDCKVNAPKTETYATVTYAWDPSGVLLHFAEKR